MRTCPRITRSSHFRIVVVPIALRRAGRVRSKTRIESIWICSLCIDIPASRNTNFSLLIYSWAIGCSPLRPIQKLTCLLLFDKFFLNFKERFREYIQENVRVYLVESQHFCGIFSLTDSWFGTVLQKFEKASFCYSVLIENVENFE